MSNKKIAAAVHWQSEMHFECINRDLISHIDALEDHGGSDLGATPKELLINAMMGCTAMDVLSLLKKMRQKVTKFKMSGEADMTEEHPIHFQSVILNYDFEGDLDKDKAIKAIHLSMTKYCGVNYMISKVCPISYNVFLNGDKIMEDQVIFEV